MSSDQAFGPQLGSAFDFTLTFDHSILSILPNGLFILAAPFFIYYFKNQTEVILPGPLLWSKLGAAISLFGVNLATIVLWSLPSPRRSFLALASAALALTTSLFLVACLFLEHRHSMRSTTVLSVWLTCSIAFDGAIARSYFLREDCDDLAAMAVTSAVCKLVTMLLEEVRKTHFVRDPNTGKPVGQEATSGFWSRVLYLWLNRTFFVGFKQVLTIDDLDNLGPEFSSENLLERFNAAWIIADKTKKHSLALICYQILQMPVLSVIPPRLYFAFVTFAQPLFLQAVISAIENNVATRIKYSLIAAAALIYFSIAISRSLYQHLNYRLVTQVRGILVAAIVAKAVTLPFNHGQRGSAVTLMTTDIETIEAGLPLLQDTWINFIELGIGIYLLSRTVGKAAFLVLVSTLLSIWSSWYLAKHFPPAKEAWTASIDARVAATSTALSQIKAIKMSGMEDDVSNELRELRALEIRRSVKTRLLGAIYPVVAMACKVFTPLIVLAAGLFWTTFQGSLTVVGAFSVLAVVTLITNPLNSIMESGPVVLSALNSFARIETFLLIEEAIVHRLEQPSAAQDLDTVDEKSGDIHQSTDLTTTTADPEKDLAGYVARFVRATISAPDDPTNIILRQVSVDIAKGEFIIVSGPTGCGKSMFLKALLKEMKPMRGKIHVQQGQKAYCDQTAWIKNTSIRRNIALYGEIDDAWYDTSLDACLLGPDLERFPHSDLYMAGSNGLNLSGGQKHRVAAARAVYSRNELSILDDIFSALDSETATEMFSRLLGANGLLRRSGKTVVLATNSVEFFAAADRVVLIDSKGRCKVRTDVQSPALQDEVRELLSLQQEMARRLEEGQQAIGEQEPRATAVQNDEPAPEAGDDNAIRQRGDLRLHWFYLKSMGILRSMFWLFITALEAFAEKAPDVFLRIWLDHAPKSTLYFVVYVLISVATVLLNMVVFGFWFASAVPASLKGMHEGLLNTLMRAKFSYLSRRDHGGLLNIMSQDLTLVSQTLPIFFIRAIYLLFYVLVTIGVLVSGVDYAGTIIPLLLAAVHIIQHIYLRTSRQVRHLDIEKKEPLYTLLTETAAGLAHIRAFGWQEDIVQEGLVVLDNSQKPYYHMFSIQRWLILVMDLLVLAIAMAILPIAFNVKLSTTASGLALSLVSLIQFSDILCAFIEYWTSLETSFGALARIRGFLQTTPQEPSTGGNVDPAWPHEGHVVMRNVTAKYDSTDTGPATLRDINLDVEPGKKIGIVGRTGSGKTSLLLTALNFLDYTGSIIIDGVDILTISPRVLRSRIPTISQDSISGEGTVRSLICPWPEDMPLEQYDDLEGYAVELLWNFNLWSVLRTKGGLETTLPELSLSQGQLQLLAIVRGLVRHQMTGSKVIIMDEPTSSLDNETHQMVQRVFDEELRDCTIITVAHRVQSIMRADTVYQITDGKISSRSDRQPDAGPRPAWNPDEHRYIGHAGPYESSEDGARLLGTFVGEELPLSLRMYLARVRRARELDIKRRGLKGDDGQPMTPITYGQRVLMPRFLRATRKVFAKRRKAGQAEQAEQAEQADRE